jgi:hypothetical protein
MYKQYVYFEKWAGVGEVREKVERGATVHKRGRKYQHD